ncbi:MAG: DoxX family protein [Chloracidobacterium sp.]|nr:DoxX family protein [Chloracidobacterium sp.]
MKLEHTLDDLYVALTRRWWTQMFTAFTRCLLALAFIPPSIPKIMHKPFTTLPDSNPVGHYFNALMDTGFYYEFIGWSQIMAAILLLIPRTSHIGAMIFLPIIANIAVLTCSVGFQGTWLLTIFMCLAAVYLVAWEYDRLKPLIFFTREDKPRRFKYQYVAISLFFAGGGVVMGVLWWMIRLGNFSDYFRVGFGLTITGAIFGLIVALHYRSMPVGHLSSTQ